MTWKLMRKNWKMKRVYHNYKLWEDNRNGMYDTSPKYNEQETEILVQLAVKLLTDNDRFYSTAKDMVDDWKISAEQNLTIASRNHEAWLGQASCSYAHKIPERITKLAWKMLKVSEQLEANTVAQKVIDEWWDIQDYDR
jgi:hypothetical protein